MPPQDVKSNRENLFKQISADPEASQRFGDFVSESLGSYIRRINESVRRVSELLSLAEEVTRPSLVASRASAGQDVIRAAVVLLHAYLEDFLRTIALVLLPSAAEAALDGLPLAGTDPRRDKFQLGELARHRGKLVDDVLRESVLQHLERETYNNTDAVAHLLKTLGFEVSKYTGYFPKVQEMMLRRHQIVHRADRIQVGQSEPALQAIQTKEVDDWVETLVGFMGQLSADAVLKAWPVEKIADQIGFKAPPGQK